MDARHFYNTCGTNLLSLESIENANAQIAQLRAMSEKNDGNAELVCQISMAMARLIEVSNGYQWRLFPSTAFEKPHPADDPDLGRTIEKIGRKRGGAFDNILDRILDAFRSDPGLLIQLLLLIGGLALLLFFVIGDR